MPRDIQAIVLAAGLSTRAEKYKLTLEVNDKTVIENAVGSLISCCSEVIVVGGHNFSIINEVLNPCPGVKMIYNPNYLDGMFSSVREGLKYINGDRFFILPGDYPLIKASTCGEMLLAEGDIVIPEYRERKGHPVLIRSSLREDIINNPEYKSLRDFINHRGFSKIEVDDPGILIDIDTMEDYKNILDGTCSPLIK